jgi:hypothetical protein
VVLIAGHTHRPVFMSESLTRKVSRELVAARSELAALRSGELDPASAAPAEELRQRVAALRAQLEWLRTGSSNDEGPYRMTGARMKPCYFNTGCCCFPDGDITGIEIADGQIRLVRWPDAQGRPRPRVLATADLRRDVLWRPKSPAAPVKTSGAGLS